MPRLKVASIGEAMLEFAPLGGGLFRQGFAGDTMNTCWQLAQLLGDRGDVAYVTKAGTDAFSDGLLAFLAAGNVTTARIGRDPDRRLGLYVISLAGAERSFAYWRDTSAAKRLADDPAELAAAIADRDLIFVSGITLAIIEERGRRALLEVLAAARQRGATVAFDPNVRMRLWPDEATVRAAVLDMLKVTDIALPSFDDEAKLWGDLDPAGTLARLAAAGVRESAVKNGAGPVFFQRDADRGQLAAAAVSDVRDTTGAGDAFNAGYLAARLSGLPQPDCCAMGHFVAAETLKVYGALPPPAVLAPLRDTLSALAQRPNPQAQP